MLMWLCDFNSVPLQKFMSNDFLKKVNSLRYNTIDLIWIKSFPIKGFNFTVFNVKVGHFATIWSPHFCLSLTDVPPTQSTNFPGICPEDSKEEYHQSYSWLPFKGHCYLFITDEIEWADAASSCVRHGKGQPIQKTLDTCWKCVS